MENYTESTRWIRDARDNLQWARHCFAENNWRSTIQNAQLAIELSVKGMIALFEEPDWTHKPDEQLIRIIEERKDEIIARFGQQMVNELMEAAQDAVVAAPWHGWSVYGKVNEHGTRWAAVDLCTENIAKDLMNRAEKTFATVEKFLQGVRVE